MCDKTMIRVLEKDKEYLEKLKKKMRKGSMWAVLESMIILIKHHKLEGELR